MTHPTPRNLGQLVTHRALHIWSTALRAPRTGMLRVLARRLDAFPAAVAVETAKRGMAGHSKWHNIQHKKKKADIVRGLRGGRICARC